MLGTSKMFLNKTIKGQIRYSDNVKDNAVVASDYEDEDNYNITRDFQTRCYETNDWVRAIVDLTTERASQVDIFPRPLAAKIGADRKVNGGVKKRMEQVMNILLKPNSDMESINALVKKVTKDIMIYDEAGMQMIRDTRYSENKKIALYANISGEELFVNPQKDGTLPDLKTYAQVRNRKIIDTFDKYDFMNFIKNRRAGYANGFSPISTIAVSIMSDFEMLNYNYKFFENNAQPNLAFIFENLGFGKGQGALERAKSWYLQEHQGKPHNPLFMGGEKGNVKLQELKTTHKDMEFSNWELLLISRIMAVFGMQPMVLGILTDTTGKLNSEVQTEQFKKNAIIPLIRTIVYTMNSVLLWADQNLNYDDIYLTTTNLDIDDEKKTAEIDEKYLEKGVITINQVRNKLQMPAVDWGNEPFVPLNYAPWSNLIKYQQAMITSSKNKAPIDNNAKSGDDEDKDKKKEGAQKQFHVDNFKVPTGLEKIEVTELQEILTKIISERESKLSKEYSFPAGESGSLLGTIGAYDLTCKEVMTKQEL